LLPTVRCPADFHCSRCDSGFALSYREHLPWIVALNLRSRLLALLTSNSGEGFPKVSINASRVTKRIIEDRFHLASSDVVVSYECFYLREQQDAFPARRTHAGSVAWDR